jgi:calcium-dependent protein kinase
MSQKEIGGLVEIFNQLDADEDGELSFEEFQAGISQLNPKTAEELKEVFNQLDADKNGSINYTEFIAANMSQKMYLKEEKIYQAFKLFDKNGDGFITADEIKEVLGRKPIHDLKRTTFLTFLKPRILTLE